MVHVMTDEEVAKELSGRDVVFPYRRHDHYSIEHAGTSFEDLKRYAAKMVERIIYRNEVLPYIQHLCDEYIAIPKSMMRKE